MYRKFLSRILALSLSFVLIFGAFDSVTVAAETVDYASLRRQLAESGLPLTLEEMTPAAREVFTEMQQQRTVVGLVGFEGEYALPQGGAPVNAIVIFEHSPAGIQQIEASLDGVNLPRMQAEANVEEAHSSFRAALEDLFRIMPLSGEPRSFDIYAEFRLGINGVGITLPADMLDAVAEFPMVRVIYPDSLVEPPPEPTPIDEVMGAFYSVQTDRDPFGNRAGRHRMGANWMHDEGFRGEGVLIGVIDSGIDWMHPAFRDTFPTVAEMRARGATHITNANAINIGTAANPDYRFVGWDMVRYWPGRPELGNPHPNDPMESAPFNFVGVPNLPAGWQSHGTHVSGSIVGRDVEGHFTTHPELFQLAAITFDPQGGTVIPGTGGYPTPPALPEGGVDPLDFSILGVAPGALAVHYRALWGGTPGTIIIGAVEQAFIDGVDIVNMSLGAGTGTATAIQNIVINNLMLQNPEIVFVIAAGNAGPNFSTTDNWGASTLALTISALREPGSSNVEVVSPDLGVPSGVANMTFAQMGLFLDTFSIPGRAIFGAHPAGTRNDPDGTFTIFAMPDVSNTDWVADPPMPAVGAGTDADFAALVAQHGDALRGNWVLVRRGHTFVDLAATAARYGIGGVVQINTGHQAFAATPTLPVPFLSLENEAGLAMSAAILAGNGIGTFHITGLINHFTNLHVIPFSGRGPVLGSLEINPDFGAHGVDVLSAAPRWAAGLPWDNDHMDNENFRGAYALSSGTSMSAPHVAGGVALLIQYLRANNLPINNQDIKARLMNTAIPVTYTAPGEHGGYSVFDGARQVNLRAAAEATTRVSGLTLAATEVGWEFSGQPRIFARTGSLSFGAVATNGRATVEGVIFSQLGGAYRLTADFIDTGRMSQPGGEIEFSTNGTTWSNALTVSVPSGGETRFFTRLTAGSTTGHYEGYVTVTHTVRQAQIARLPFAGVGVEAAPLPVSDLRFYRSIVSTGENVANNRSSQLSIYYVPHAGFEFDTFLFRVDGDTLIPAGPAPSGFVGTSTFSIHALPAVGGPLGQLYRATVLDVADLNLLEGEYRLRFDFRQIYLNPAGGIIGINPSESVYLPFWVDNTPPEITNLQLTGIDLGGQDLNDAGEIILVNNFSPTGDITLTGNVSDVFTAENEGNIPFNIWNNPRMLDVSEHVVLFASINGADAVQIPLSANGDFTIVHPAVGTQFMDIQLWALDAWSAVPVFESSRAPVHFPTQAQQFWIVSILALADVFEGSHIEIEDEATLSLIPPSAHMWMGGANFGGIPVSFWVQRFAYTGVNVAEFSTLITDGTRSVNDYFLWPPITPIVPEEPEEEELEEPEDGDEPENGGEPGDEDEPEETDPPSPPEDPEEEELEEPEDGDDPENGGEPGDEDEPEETDPPSPPEDPTTEEINLTLATQVASLGENLGLLSDAPIGQLVNVETRNDGTYTARIARQHRFGASLPTAVSPGLVFAGWNTRPDGTGANFTANTIVTSDMTVYAIWQSPPPPPLLPPGPAQPEDDFLDGPVIPITPWVPRPTTQVAADPADPDEADEPVLPGFVNPDGTVDLTFTMTATEWYELVIFLPGVDDGVYELEIEGLPAGARIDQTAALPDWAFDVALERFLEMQEDEEEETETEGVATLFRRLAPQLLSLNLENIATIAQTEGLSPETIAGVEAILEEMLFKEITDQILSLELLDVTDDMVGTHVLNLSLLDQNSDEVINLPNLVLVIEPTAVEEPPVVEQPPQQLVTAPQSVETRFIVGSPSFTVNGVPRTDAEGLAPFIDPEYDRTMMPLRLIAEIFGAEVSWNEETRTAIIISGGITLQIPLDTPLPDGLGMPSIVNDRAFVPLRYIAENLGVQVEWDGVNQAIYIRQ